MSENPIQDLVIATTSAVIANHAEDAFYVILGMWYCIFGYHWDMTTDKIQVNHLKNLGEFRNELVNEINAIPPQNIQPPKNSIVGPALEASKFYMDDGEIRQMFARLIATSMDKNRNDKTHPAFVEVIKMLSPLDAKNLYYLYTIKDESICNRIIKVGNIGSYNIITNHVWLGNPENPNHRLQQVSIDNLIRLGLVTVSYDRTLSEDSHYENHRTNQDYLNFVHEVQIVASNAKKDLIVLNGDNDISDGNGNIINDFRRQELIKIKENEATWESDLQRGVIRMTAFGTNLCEVCLPTM